MVAEEEEKKHENYQKTKRVRISLHACLTSAGWNQTPTVIVFQRLYSGATKDSSGKIFYPQLLTILP